MIRQKTETSKQIRPVNIFTFVCCITENTDKRSESYYSSSNTENKINVLNIYGGLGRHMTKDR